MENKKLFLEVLRKLNENQLLEDVILIGSWCLYVYRYYFNDDKYIPLKRTVDLDFLLKNPPKIKHKANVEEILKELDFRISYNATNDFSKFVHPDLEVEFLMNQKGSGINDYYNVKELGVKAVQLRYLDFLENNILLVNYEGLILKIPEPSAFTLHKYIVSKRRLKPEKAKKDLETAKEMSDFLLKNDNEREKLKIVYNSVAKKWQKTLLDILKTDHIALYNLLK